MLDWTPSKILANGQIINAFDSVFDPFLSMITGTIFEDLHCIRMKRSDIVRFGLQKLKSEQTGVSHFEFELNLSAFEFSKFPIRFLLVCPKNR